MRLFLRISATADGGKAGHMSVLWQEARQGPSVQESILARRLNGNVGMQLGIVFPTTDTGSDPAAIREWAQSAEAGSKQEKGRDRG